MQLFKPNIVKIKTKRGTFGFEMSPSEHILFVTVGRAMTRIQNFEVIVATILCSLEASRDQLALENIDVTLDEFNSQTLGRLINHMKQKVKGDDLHKKLMSVRDGRNFIAHHSLRTYSELDEEGAIELVEKIESIAAEIDEVQDLLISELSAQNITHISEIYLDEET